MKWYTQSKYVHLETGEELTKKEAESNYIKKNKTINYEIKSEHGIKWITYECTRTGKQLELF